MPPTCTQLRVTLPSSALTAIGGREGEWSDPTRREVLLRRLHTAYLRCFYTSLPFNMERTILSLAGSPSSTAAITASSFARDERVAVFRVDARQSSHLHAATRLQWLAGGTAGCSFHVAHLADAPSADLSQSGVTCADDEELSVRSLRNESTEGSLAGGRVNLGLSASAPYTAFDSSAAIRLNLIFGSALWRPSKHLDGVAMTVEGVGDSVGAAASSFMPLHKVRGDGPHPIAPRRAASRARWPTSHRVLSEFPADLLTGAAGGGR